MTRRSELSVASLADLAADLGERRLGVVAQNLDGSDADDGDQGNEQRVLNQGGSTLGATELGALAPGQRCS